ncbi:MAG: ADP-forming succinate--CoA ligase subunit beta [Gemmatimonadetes bacterium]|nr:MAG: ADP-forming succinate--CoA ligase subunit beta [Gemmatimonadota bacterium]GDX87211.1 succinate--CoA ligase [ADP-forming] subunit beta [Gemmatimonadota bacterium]
MNLHEYQAKDILRRFGVTTPQGEVVTTPEAAREAATKFGGPVMVKAQVHVGGRGKAGGVKFCTTADEAYEKASNILGMSIKGLTVTKVLIAPAADIVSEAYVGIIVDRARKKPVFMVSAAGGIDIEEVAATTPEKIRYHAVDVRYGLMPFEALELGFFLYQDAKLARAAAKVMQQLYAAFMATGCSLAEINPLVVTPAGDVVALDGKMVVDDNELERRADLEALRDVESENPAEVDARNHNLTFIKLDGNVGCIVNGAGLAMATMDLVKYYGGEPANFLDIGGSSNPEKVVNALRLITADPNVKAILFNIFGGITRTDDVANGIVTAIKSNPLKVPLIIRLTGTNEEIAMQILKQNGLSASSDMDEAVKEAVRLAAAASGGTAA